MTYFFSISKNIDLWVPSGHLPLLSVIKQEYSTSEKMKTVEQLVDNLDEVVFQNNQRLWSSLRAVSFDPETAHPELEVLADTLEVNCKKPIPERKRNTNISNSVQVKERFSSSSHYWEVAVWKKPYWLIGLSYVSVARDKDFEHCNSDFKSLAVSKTIQKLAVWLDIPKGAMSFYDGDTLTLLDSFRFEFSGPVCPIFNPCIDINGHNCQPLSIVHLRNKNIS